jgi:hypothetical protein
MYCLKKWSIQLYIRRRKLSYHGEGFASTQLYFNSFYYYNKLPYMFWSYDHLEAEIHVYTWEINAIDNRSVPPEDGGTSETCSGVNNY